MPDSIESIIIIIISLSELPSQICLIKKSDHIPMLR